MSFGSPELIDKIHPVLKDAVLQPFPCRPTKQKVGVDPDLLGEHSTAEVSVHVVELRDTGQEGVLYNRIYQKGTPNLKSVVSR